MKGMIRLVIVSSVILILALAACTTTQQTEQPQPTQPAREEGGPIEELGTGEGQVDIIAWAGYIERGETDPAYDWVTDFEAETGCQVNVKVAATSDEMVALMNEGGFDLVTASGDASNRLISGGKVQEINTDLVPSFTTIDARLQSSPWHTVDGKHYGVPYQWGSNVLMYKFSQEEIAPNEDQGILFFFAFGPQTATLDYHEEYRNLPFIALLV